nr:hypothetical protein Iba_chr11fCG3630 [Ipomoea batatas]
MLFQLLRREQEWDTLNGLYARNGTHSTGCMPGMGHTQRAVCQEWDTLKGAGCMGHTQRGGLYARNGTGCMPGMGHTQRAVCHKTDATFPYSKSFRVADQGDERIGGPDTVYDEDFVISALDALNLLGKMPMSYYVEHQRLATVLGQDLVVVSCLANLLPNYFNDNDWKKRYTGVISLGLIAPGLIPSKETSFLQSRLLTGMDRHEMSVIQNRRQQTEQQLAEFHVTRVSERYILQ